MTTSRYPTLVSGGRVLEIGGDLDQPPVTDLLIENGRIVATGAAASSLADQYSALKRIDAREKLVIPGLINAHYHSHDVMMRGMYEQLPLDAWMLYTGPANYSRPSASQVELRTSLGAAECLLNGITTVQDMPSLVGADHEHVDAILSSYEKSGLRVSLALQMSDRAPADCVPYWRELPAQILNFVNKPIDVRPMQKLIEERVTQKNHARLRWALGPSGPQRCSAELLSWNATLARKHGLQVFTHLYETRAQAVLARQGYPGSSLVKHLESCGLLDSSLTIAHGVWITEDEIERFGAAGANVACNPISNMKLLNGFAPIVQYAEAYAGIGLGCDNCSGSDAQNLFQSMKAFALFWGMYSRAGEVGAAREAFKAATVGGARALGMEKELGLLRPGYKADLVLIDLRGASYRPLNSAVKQLVYSESGSGVETVIVDGEIVVENRKLKTISEDALKAQSEDWRDALSKEHECVHKRNEAMMPEVLLAYEKANLYPLEIDRFLFRKH